jgi:deoxyribose-phosphate aldolase
MAETTKASAAATPTVAQIASMIDHSLLHPTLTDAEILEGLHIARRHNVAAACVKPYSIAAAREVLAGSSVKICAVVGFPAGNSTTRIKVLEAEEAVRSGAHEIDVVVNVGKVLSQDWEYVAAEIKAVNDAATSTAVGGDSSGSCGILKVIFENDYLPDEAIVRLCQICSDIGVAFVKTSTGFGFVKQSNGMYSYKGATLPHLKLMRASCPSQVEIKAAGGVRTLADVLAVLELGVTRIGATATESIIKEVEDRRLT